MDSRSALRVALFSVDPPGLTLFKSFDPDSFSLISAIHDSLVRIDAEGVLQPALAVAWRALSPCEWELDLRRGVRFHHGKAFDADDVVATFQAHHEPTPSAAAKGVLMPIKRVTKVDAYRVRIETHFPDVLLLRRLFLVSIYPSDILAREGREIFETQPIGTGAYRLARYERGVEIVLARNEEHWARAATVDIVRLPILRQKEWLDRLARGDIDVAWNLDSHDVLRAQRLPGVHGASRCAAVSQLFLLSNRGPLADVRVRRALNHAINRRVLVEITEHGLGDVQRGVAGPHVEGSTELEAYRYSPDVARRMLEEAGYGEGFTLRGLVSESSTAIFFATREFLARVGVRLEADFVPRPVWMKAVIGGNLAHRPYEGDFAVTSSDNPLLHSMFMQFLFFHSHAPGSLMRSSELDEEIRRAVTGVDDPKAALARLERYHRDGAHMLYTVEQHAHAAWREGVGVTIPRSGHFNVAAFWGLSIEGATRLDRGPLPVPPAPPMRDLGTLLEATSHPGTFYLAPEATLDDTTARRIWTNLVESEERWRVQNEPMFREIVELVEARTNLATVLESTDRVAIVGYTPEGRRRFANRGFARMFGDARAFAPEDLLGDQEGARGWSVLRPIVERDGAWLGPVHMPRDGRPLGAPERLFLAVTAARDEDGVLLGHTFVFSDFSGEEERIRTAATRTILEKVPYGLFVLDAAGRMKPGYSDACLRMFPGAGATDLVGRTLPDLLRLDGRTSAAFEIAFQQVIDDFLPPETTLGQIPERVRAGDRTYRLEGSVVRGGGGAGAVEGVLFTMLDITTQIQAEREAESHKATIAVLRFRDTFERFAIDLHASLGRFIDAGSHASQVEVRAALHTAKGVFSQLFLRDLAEQVHALEDEEIIGEPSLRALRRAFEDTLAAHRDLWKIEVAAAEPTFTVTQTFVLEFERAAAQARSEGELRAMVEAKLSALREKPAWELLGPLDQTATQLAVRREKAPLLVVIEGGEVRVPVAHAAPLASLVHLVRNAVDHGIETAEERGEKPPFATLRIRVARDEHAVTVDVSDDGAGIDAEAVAERAVSLGVVDEARLRAMTEREKLELIFVDGLSTAPVITDTSGRGIGSRATRDAVSAAGGSISVTSTRGEGTTFAIVLPLRPREERPLQILRRAAAEAAPSRRA